MATTVTGKLNQAASIFAAGESTGFGLRIGVQYYDRETSQKEWTNYECAVFAKAPGQIEFYKSGLVEGAIVEITGQQLKIKTFDGQNGQRLSIELIDARLGYIGTVGQGQAPQQQAPAQGGYQQPAPNQGGFAPAPQQRPAAQPNQPQNNQGGYQHPQQGYNQAGK
ncbi:nucleic acid-binding, OB-fold protein [Vibrio phage 1.076.O._10N.286.51.B7]|nr:nucleic acid-binding, OB-fold protein [Vibrio phage 1.076.O._10N.286.51.B7]